MAPGNCRRVGIVVATGRVAAVFLDGQQLVGWQRSAKAFVSSENATAIVARWVDGFMAHHVIFEDRGCVAQKGKQSRAITDALVEYFENADCLAVRVRRQTDCMNRYEQAARLVERFPNSKAILPKQPPIWLPENRNLSYFDALALTTTLIDAEITRT